MNFAAFKTSDALMTSYGSRTLRVTSKGTGILNYAREGTEVRLSLFGQMEEQVRSVG